MDRTIFAGLTALVPGDALETDGGSFLWRNPEVLDHFAEVGAVTHKHDAHAALATPSAAPAVVASGGGGTIGNDVTLWVGYTLTDAYGGETAISPVASAATPGALAGAGSSPTVAFSSAAGSLAVGTYYYAVTLIDGLGGETTLSDYGEATRLPGYASGEMIVSGLTALMTAVGAVGWRLYRSFNGGGWGYMTQGSSDGFVDDGSLCADVTIGPPDTNSTGGTNSMLATVPGQASGVTVRLYASEAGDFTSPAFVVAFPRVGTASAVTIKNTDFAVGSPPPVSTAKQGANPIDALTDVINLASATSLGLSSAWASAGSGWQAPRAIKTADGFVTVEGVAGKITGSPVAGEKVLDLPALWRPKSRLPFEVSVVDVRGRSSIDVASGGAITLGETPGGSAVSLSARFYTG
jgi:hypothetical protein